MQNTKLEMIVAMDRDRGIGYKGQLPWPRIPEDMAWFRKNTLGKSVIMGRKTAESIGKPLEERQNLVISTKPEQVPECFTVVNTLAEAISISENQPIIIGGASIYEAALPKTCKIYLTEIKQIYQADVHFPSISNDWVVKSETSIRNITFRILENIT